MFKINWKYFLANLLPPILRQDKQIAWLQVITTMLRQVYDEFQQLKDKWFCDINYTGQVCYLQSRLKLVDSSAQIIDGTLIDTMSLCNINEAFVPVFFNNIEEEIEPTRLINISELQVIADFYIKISNMSKAEQIKSIVNQFKLYDKTYKIIQNEQIIDDYIWSDANIS